MTGDELSRAAMAIYADLCQLEQVLLYVPDDDKGFIFQGMREAHELVQIGVHETTRRATRLQVQHLRQLQRRITRIANTIPNKAYEELDDDDD